MMVFPRRILMATCLLFTFKVFAQDAVAPNSAGTSAMSAEQGEYSAQMSSQVMKSPVGRWALLRKGDDWCAIRFLKAYRLHASVDSAGESYFAEYDWYHQREGGVFRPSASHGTGEAYKKPNIWRFTRSEGVHCGPISAKWGYPNGISLLASDFNPESKNESNGVEVALTGWRRIEDVNMNDARLVWRRYGPARDSKYLYGKDAVPVPVESLPGARDN